jgi:hypothetical protein
MDEISNKTLATLLVVAIVISLAGTFFAMRGVSQVTNIISGAQTYGTSGVAKVNITEQLSIVLIENLVDFGAGNRKTTLATGSACNLSSADSTIPSCWNETASGSYLGGFSTSGDFMIQNDGNLNANITIDSLKDQTTFFTGCTGSGTILAPGTENYTYTSLTAASRPGCLSGTVSETAFDAGDPHVICSNLTFDDASDQMNVTIKLYVPSGPSGICNDTVTFTAMRNY